ncbi:tRNA(Glu)-specific nuclease WapA precursor [Polystyrenella longa]|uniref:tRNA(Glu)-specific nuclease WapA n=1 Tax=Polystyrenella longa TaxID=2528007 RepID=A0A518CLJ8_9PLAN|nr:RHS repeat-associated core domain-containing protein [Polystyrenella longa]QDU80097.1 tRNA(Glu)-specific nuclease WapA precursor [Polystyrenella longa]
MDTFNWTYDDLGRLVTEVFDSHDNVLDFEANYTYDLVGNRLEKTVDQDLDLDIDETYTYTYNTSDQLLTETKVVGNVDDGTNFETDDTTTTYSYTNTLQTAKQVIETYSTDVISNTTYGFNLQGRMDEVVTDTYDSNGDVVRRETATYEYDDKGIRVEATQKVEVDHDTDPLTALQVESDETTTYLSDPMNHTGYSQVIEEVTVDNLNSMSETERVIYTLGLDVLQQVKYDSANPTGLNSIMLHDGHGSTRMLTDMLGAVTIVNSIPQIFTYDAYGESLGFNKADAATSFLYSGELFDSRIGQQYLRARYYDFATGTFNRLDPFFGNLKDPQSLHKYLYTHGDPVNGIDPSGLFVDFGTSAFGYAVEAEIEAVYALTFPHRMPDTEFGKWAKLSFTDTDRIPGSAWFAKPDIIDHNRYKYMEIKPWSPTGTIAAKAQMKVRAAQFSRFGYTPDPTWPPEPTPFYTFLTLEVPVMVFNIEGVIFYSDYLQIAAEFVVGVTLAEVASYQLYTIAVSSAPNIRVVAQTGLAIARGWSRAAVTSLNAGIQSSTSRATMTSTLAGGAI